MIHADTCQDYQDSKILIFVLSFAYAPISHSQGQQHDYAFVLFC